MLSIKILLMSLSLTNAVITDLQKSRVRHIVVQIFNLPHYTINFFEPMYEGAYQRAGNDIDNINRDIVAYNTVYYAAQAFQMGRAQEVANTLHYAAQAFQMGRAQEVANTLHYAAHAFQIGRAQGIAQGHDQQRAQGIAQGHDQRRAVGQHQTDGRCLPTIREEPI